MKTRKIVIAGANGFIGNYLQQQFSAKGNVCITIGRQNCAVNWTDEAGILSALNGADVLINLAGKSVNCRYTASNKAQIFSSRLTTTSLLNKCLRACDQPPKLWINASTATIYRHAEDFPMTEKKGEIGEGFSVEVAKLWEKTFFESSTTSTRKVALRMAIVAHHSGGALKEYMKIVKLGLGGRQGNGNQRFSWIALEDVYRIIEFIYANQSIAGVINCSAPESVKNKQLMQLLVKQLMPIFSIPTPKWMLEIGATILRTETELLLKSRWVYPEILLQNGFQFQYPTLQSFLQSSFNKQTK